ncbi:TPA: hypothetical protein DCZ39_00050 [Patescibacteria group bacterium]|nr:hypothetical protein [Candidatus Gracilibacteria bacterium]
MLITQKIENILPENLKNKLNITDILFGSDNQKTAIGDREEIFLISNNINYGGIITIFLFAGIIIFFIRSIRRKKGKRAAIHHPEAHKHPVHHHPKKK